MATGLAIAGIVGAAVSAGVSIHQTTQQKKAAKSAAAAMDAASQKAATVSTADTAGEQKMTRANAQNDTQSAARRRMSVQSTVLSPTGQMGRRTLG